MNFPVPIFADAEAAGGSVTDEAHYRLITFAVYALVILAVLAWVIFIRKQKNKRRRIHKHHPHTWQQPHDEQKRRHHRRRKRPAELPQNPSLADTSGLPPRRPDDVPPRGT